MSKKYFYIAVLVALLGGVVATVSWIALKEQGPAGIADYKNAEYSIEGQKIKLENGVAETEAAPGSASAIITRYFGNELQTDLNGDGREDVVFILTQERGGSGTFFYVVAALNTERGYIGSDGYLLGDRVAPQTTEVSQNPRHKHVIVVNYADRALGEPMTAQPSVGKSVYLKLDPATMQWGIVEPDFEGEEGAVGEFWGTIMGTVLLGPTCPVVMDPPEPGCADKPYATSLVLTSSDGAHVLRTFSSSAEGTFTIEAPPGHYAIRSAAVANIRPYCQSNGTFELSVNGFVEVLVSCDTGIR
jgi:hypothetical protein